MRGFPLDLTLEAEGGLTLSRPTEADVDDLVAACQDPDIVRFTRVPSPYRAAHARDFVLLSVRGAIDGTALNVLARDGEGRVLAACGLPRVSLPDRAGEVGYWVAPWARRRGVATRATRAVCHWAFGVGRLERLHLEAAVDNPGSNGVARALGFTLEGTQRRAAIEAAGSRQSTRRMDMNLWGLLPGELA